MEHRSVRLLSRRYNLTAMVTSIWKLESASTELCGDRPGRLSRTQTVAVSQNGKSFYEQRWNIYKMLRNEYKDNFINVAPLTVRVCTLNNVTLVRLDSSSIRMTTETTLRRMFEFDRCIDVTFELLIWLVDTIDVKYTWFSNIASKDAICVATSSMKISSSTANYWP